MEKNYLAKLRHIHRVNRILWSSILIAILAMVIVVVIFNYSHLLTKPEVNNLKILNTIFFSLVVGLVFLGIYIKRTYLIPSKMIARAQKHDINISASDVTDFVEEFGKEANLLAKTLIIMRRYYMVIWSIANLIVMVGFIQYIIGVHFDNFIILSIVGLYSLTINFPRFAIIETCYYRIENEKFK